MNRSRFGAVLLLLLLLAGLLSTGVMERVHRPIARDLSAAGELALEDRWGEALALSRRAAHYWQRISPLVACLSHHQSMEQIDEAFARLELLAKTRSKEAFAAACAAAAGKLAALGQSHRPNLANLL